MFLIAFAKGVDTRNINKYPAMLDEIDFALAYFLFSLSAPGVAIIAKGRATLERTREVVAQNSAELSDANKSAFLKYLEL